MLGKVTVTAICRKLFFISIFDKIMREIKHQETAFYLLFICMMT